MVNVIKQRLISILPDSWENVDVFANIGENCYQIFFFAEVNGKQYQYSELEKVNGFSEEEIDKVFEDIYKECENKNIIKGRGIYFSFTPQETTEPIPIEEDYTFYDWTMKYKK